MKLSDMSDEQMQEVVRGQTTAELERTVDNLTSAIFDMSRQLVHAKRVLEEKLKANASVTLDPETATFQCPKCGEVMSHLNKVKPKRIRKRPTGKKGSSPN